MTTLIPVDGYNDFSITPELPSGLQLDSRNGWISGRSGETVNSTVYTVIAHNAIGGSVNASFDLSSIQCMEGKDLITIRVRSDRLPNENSWKVYKEW